MPKKTNTIPGIEKRGKSWMARYYGTDGKQHSKSFRTQQEAKEFKQTMDRSVKRGEWLDPNRSDITLNEWFDIWIPTKAGRAPKTVTGYKQTFSSHIAPHFGSWKLNSITHMDVQAWVSQAVKGGVGLSALRHAVGLLSRLFASAILDERVSRNPATNIDLPKKLKKEIRILTPSELHQLAGACGGYSTMVYFAALTGMRFGEIAALQVADINLLKREVKVNKAVREDESRKPVIGPTKTHSIRTVPVPKELKELLEKQIQGKSAEDFLFTGDRGGMLNHNWFTRKRFNPARAQVGMADVTFHMLRHTCASLLIQINTPIKVISEILGHETIVITMDTYGHLYDGDAKVWIDNLGTSIGVLTA
jgi:integrase